MQDRDYRIIAVDFDGTLCKDEWPYIGEPNVDMVNYIKKCKKDGDKVILWTCRAGEELLKAVAWCRRYGIILDAVNENLPEMIEKYGGDSRKIFADEYIDDKIKAPDKINKVDLADLLINSKLGGKL